MIRKRCVGRPGQSLVEVLVAMVVLLIGIFGIIQIFPRGFGIINYSEHVSQAQSLARAALESARANAQNLPDSVVPIDFTGTLNGTLTLTDNAADSPQTVTINGIGRDVALNVPRIARSRRLMSQGSQTRR